MAQNNQPKDLASDKVPMHKRMAMGEKLNGQSLGSKAKETPTKKK